MAYQLKQLIDASLYFWSHYPGFLYGLLALLAAAFILFFHWALFFPLTFFFFPLFFAFRRSQRIMMALAFFFAMLGFISLQSKQNSSSSLGWLIFHPEKLRSVHSSFGSQWVYQGQGIFFVEKKPKALFKEPLTIRLDKRKISKRPKADQSYLIFGRMRPNLAKKGMASFSPIKGSWKAIPNTLHSAEWRFQAKETVKKYIESKLGLGPSSSFLSGALTGDFDDKRLSNHFNRFGLQHIMAVSGFHFSILALFLSLILGLFFSPKWSAGLLFFSLTAYFFFVGMAPSVLRAWIAIALVQLSFLLGKRAMALNSLGIALIATVILDPFAVSNLGFQFSFAITAAILVFTPYFQRYLELIFKKRALSVVVEMNLLTQHGYLFLNYLRATFALSMAVNIVAIPMTLLHFQTFPLMSLAYNLFFPLATAIVIQLFLLAIIIDFFLPFLGQVLFLLIKKATMAVLGFATNLPISLDYKVQSDFFTYELIIIFLTFLIVAAVWLHSQKKDAPIEQFL